MLQTTVSLRRLFGAPKTRYMLKTWPILAKFVMLDWFFIISAIKNGFSIASTEDGEIQISVDNVYPLLKALGLNPQNESVMDMVRDACMECK